MELIPSFFTDYFIALALCVIFYIAGHSLCAFFPQKKNEPYAAVFFRLITGVIAVVTLFAVIWAKGRTSLLGIVFLCLYVLFISVKNKEISVANWKENFRQWHFSALGVFALFLLMATVPFYLLLVNVYGQMLVPSADYSLYAALAYKLAHFGIESVNLHISNILQDSPNFYHYFELWFSALVYKIFGVSTYYALLLIAYPVFVALTCLGAFQLTLRFLCKNTVISFLISLLVLFIAPFPISIKSFSLDIFHHIIYSVILTKQGVVYVMLMWFFLVYEKNNWLKNLFPFAFLSLLYLPTMPALVVSSLIFITILFLIKNIDFKLFSKLTLLFFIPVFYVAVFYALVSKSVAVEVFDDNLKNEGLAYYLKDIYLNGGGFFIFIKIFIKSCLNITLSFLPWCVLLFFVDWKNLLQKHSKLLVLFALFFVVGLTGATLIFIQENAMQLFSNLNFPVIVISIFICLLLLFKKFGNRFEFWNLQALSFASLGRKCNTPHKRRAVRYATLQVPVANLRLAALCCKTTFYRTIMPAAYTFKKHILIVLLIFLNFSGFYFGYNAIKKKSHPADEFFYGEIKRELQGKHYTAAYIKDSADYHEYDYQYQLWQKSINYTIPFPEIRRFSPSYYPVCLSIFDISIETPRERLYVAGDIVSSPFYRFVYAKNLKNNLIFAQEEYLRENRIDYLIINKNSEWLKQTGLPVRKTITGENEKYQLVFFDWE